MKKFLKISLSAIILLLIVLTGFLYSIDVNQYKADIVDIVKEKTGRDFVIEGDIGLALSLIPTFKVEGVRLGSAPWGSNPDMVKIGRFEAEVSLLPLLKGIFQINHLIVIDPEIFLETNKEGKGNWVLEGMTPQEETEASITLPAINISEITITGAKFTYKDGKTGKTTVIRVDEISSHTRSFSDPTELTIKASYNNIPINLSGTLGPLDVLAANKPYQIDLEGNIKTAKFSVSGKIEKPLEGKDIEITLSFAVASLSDLNELAETKLPAIGPIAFSAVMTQSDDVIQIKNIKLKIDQTDLAGNVTLKTGGQRPALSANLNSVFVDLTPFTGEEKQAEQKKQKKTKVFPSDKLPLEALKTVDADIRIKIKRLKIGETVLNNVDLPLKLLNGHLVIAALKSQLAGGNITLNLDLNASGKTPTLKMNINIKKLELGKLPQMQTEDGAMQGGLTDVSIKITGKGNSVAEIMAGLNGNLLVKVGKGKIPNSKVDLAGADLLMEIFNKLNPMAEKEQYSELECAVINFKIKDGIATTKKGIALQTNKMYIVGDGTINLKTEALDMGIKPHARQGIGIGVGTLASLVKIKGTLAEPKPAADISGAVEAVGSLGSSILGAGKSLFGGGKDDAQAAELNPCDIALGKAPPPAPPKKATTSTTTTTTAEGDKNVVEKTVDKVKDVFKGLFGK